ncbi:VOC family protein [Sporomusa termitida]|uniref:VOC family protein n=1 Tax=Sporomusa termitida TaxID=2377 RepID=UPI001478C6EA|nr:VOC family protein [Sporomusa termitida]
MNNIADTVRDYELLGFSMEWGSISAKAHNALLWFEQGPHIEFCQMPKRFSYFAFPFGLIYGKAAGRRLRHWAGPGEGWRDLALEIQREFDSEPLSAENNHQELQLIKEAVNKLGISTSRIIRGKRVRPDGVTVQFSLFAPDDVGLPFVTTPILPRPQPKITHPNGATGIEWVRIGVTEELSHHLAKLIPQDQWLKAEPAEQNGVIEVRLSGLNEHLAINLLHGAVFSSTHDEK